jgi:hypothetical protein
LFAVPCFAGEQLKATVASSGLVELERDGARVASLTPGLFEAEWRSASLGTGKAAEGRENVRIGQIKAPGGTIVDCEVTASSVTGGLRLAYKLTPRGQITLNSLHVSMDFPIGVIAGGAYAADGTQGTIPEQFGGTHIYSKPMKVLVLTLHDGTELTFRYDAPVQVLLQDNRQWGPTFSVRMGSSAGPARTWQAGETLDLAFELVSKEGIAMELDSPITIEAGPDWIPLALDLDIQPGSILDFSKMPWIDAPAGKHGWLIARDDGQFAYDDSPKTARRFYGVNLCFSAQYITHDESDRLADRLQRLGYNAVRFHHYEGELVDRSGGTSTVFNKDKLDQLDYLFAVLKKRGIYATTDLFVSRPVLAKEIWDGATGDVGMDNFKILVPVNEKAFDNWKTFTKNLLTHVNPYTGMTYAKDPALAWLSMINEGNCGNFLSQMDERIERDWRAAWNKWLAKRYPNVKALETAWGGPAGGDPAAGTVPIPKNVYQDSPQIRDLLVFLAETETGMFVRMKKFLRDEIGTKALLTNMNSWTNPLQYQAVRTDFDYVDDHFYVDHPQFLEKPWRLPSRCDNTSPVAGGATGGRHCTFTRLLNKPFTITEYNYSGPGRFRGVGGIITGCTAALQQWSGVWRFAYSHSRDNLFKPGTAGYFDLATDPLNQAAERATMCLFLRSDMAPAPHTVAVAMTRDELLTTGKYRLGIAPPWHALGLVTRVGTFVSDGRAKVPADIILPLGWKAGTAYQGGETLNADPYSPDTGGKVLAALKAHGWLSKNATDLSANVIQSETGELLVDAPKDMLVINTPMTAGGYAREGQTISAGSVSVKIDKTDSTVWVSSMEGKPIGKSKRLIVTHLTDLQNTGAKFGEKSRKTLLEWGRTPHLVKAGSATVTLRMDSARSARAWALTTSGKRAGEIPVVAKNKELTLKLDVAGPDGARMMYEVEVQ